MSQNTEIERETPVDTPTDERDLEAQAAIEAMQQQEQAEVEQTSSSETEQTAQETEFLDAETSRQMLAYGLHMIEFTVGGVFDVPFEIEQQAGGKWLDAATPMLQKYGPAGLEWFAKYQGELMFAMASCSLVGGSAIQVRRLRQEKIVNEAKVAKAQHEAESQGETDEVAQSNQQE
ncbi:hypothetical protein ABRZ81_11300 [Vibrio vulnificus]|uniref:hypothetical protein n=1 Tax=Vibrio vulnificus TaxID=672 RepID=UPI0032EE7BE9